MRILVTGSNGQLGKALQKVLPKKDSFFTTRKDFDITNEKETVQQIASVRPEIVIHTAAYTDVDGCEKNPSLAFLINVKGTENIVLACQKIGAKAIYISTDFVFDGKKKSPYKEEDLPNPLSVYGKTKVQGEEIIKKLPKYYIIRTAWLFGNGKNFVRTILELSKKQKEIKVVNDQVGCPTYAFDLAKAIWQLIQKKSPFGVYHITNSGQCSWYEFAKEILKLEGKSKKVEIKPITSKEWQKIKPDSAKRPKYSVLDCSRVKKLGIKIRPWQEALKSYLNSHYS